MAVTESGSRPGSDEHRMAVAQAEAALLDPAVAHLVELVLTADPDDPDRYEAASVDGRVRFRRSEGDGRWTFAVEHVAGRNPLVDQSLDRFSPLETERA